MDAVPKLHPTAGVRTASARTGIHPVRETQIKKTPANKPT